ncbi:hypothetical protein [Paenibacillus sp. GP183]|uniref:RCC1 domain-containing protein n=1 Tax=Paenibacillus sp. GP183 TaxID=1882751 RepID=UPI000897BAD8|nr:hypothetical protein [Paenibacillus sp. GP183]SEC00598.1 Regulator of chromosome condensation (RCC1) repeat-containing protein [Paenibacillus sp. GP183]
MWLSQIRNSNDVPLFKKIDNNVWSDLSAGSNHLLVLKPDGTLWSWGNNGNGELGIGTNNSSKTLVQVGTDNDWVKISAGSAFSIAQKKDNSIWKWGANSNNINALSPKKIADSMNFKSLSTSMHTVGVKVDGTLWTLGRDNGTGQILMTELFLNKLEMIQIG